MKIAIAADHAGLPLKPEIVEFVRSLGHEPVDLGAHEYDADDDYPDFAVLVAEAVDTGGKADQSDEEQQAKAHAHPGSNFDVLEHGRRGGGVFKCV